MDLDKLQHIRALTVVALFSDDELMEQLVLKGGNALDLVYKISTRASLDIDLSIESKISDIESFIDRVRKLLVETFLEHGFHVFDVTIAEVPLAISGDVKDFWGGYKIEFKLVTQDAHSRHSSDLANLRRNAEVIGPRQRRKFKIDISKFEYCDPKRSVDLLGYRVFAYSPELLVIEKLRAICQQMPKYGSVVTNANRRPRARDFVDIHTLAEEIEIDFFSDEIRRILDGVFNAKRVPIDWLLDIRDYRDYHAGDFQSVKATVHKGVELHDFEVYFNYVVNLGEQLHSFWKE